jgi:hypothetical protein
MNEKHANFDIGRCNLVDQRTPSTEQALQSAPVENGFTEDEAPDWNERSFFAERGLYGASYLS